MDNKNFSQLIRLSDFKQVRHAVYIKNETSQTSFVHDKQILIKEMGASYMIMQGPSECCQQGHQLLITLSPSQSQKIGKVPNAQLNPENVQLVARVEKYHLLDDKKTAIWTARFTQYNLKEWNSIIKAYQDQQDKINKLVLK